MGQVSKVSFRDLVKDIESTTYATHSLYMYPAKFIPHVIRYVIDRYSEPGDWLFDPFAGSGSVAIEATLTGRNAVLWDLNPIIDILIKASTYRGELNILDFDIDLNYSKQYNPTWENIHYWYPKKFYYVLSKAWGYWHYQVPNKVKPLVAIPLLKVSKYFSYADLQVAKLYKSKKSIERISKLFNSNWRDKMVDMYWKYIKKTSDKIKDYQARHPKDVEIIVKAGVDSINTVLDRDVDVLITSPPYLQAQEYIRSFKIELAWLGYGDKLTELSKREVPYNRPPFVKIYSNTYWEYRNKVKGLGNEKLLKIYDSYFRSLLYFLNNNHKRVRKVIAIFVGPVKIRGIRIPIDEILREHLERLGWEHEETLVDTIKSRRLFKVDKNPATQLDEERTPTENLLVMRNKNH